MKSTTDIPERFTASDLFAGVADFLAQIASEHERATQSSEPHGMIRALTAAEVLEAKKLHEALSPANDDEERAAMDMFMPPQAPKKEPSTAMEAAFDKACEEWEPSLGALPMKPNAQAEARGTATSANQKSL